MYLTSHGHVAALNYFIKMSGVEIFNLGTGNGISVLEMVEAFKQACGKDIPFHIAPRRDGDLPAYWAEPKKQISLFGLLTLPLKISADPWHWQSKNPKAINKLLVVFLFTIQIIIFQNSNYLDNKLYINSSL